MQQSIDDEFEALQSQLKSRKEEMKRRLYNDIEAIKRPVQEQLRKHRSINTTIDHHQRKLSLIKATQDPSLRIKVGVAVSTHFFFCKQVCKTLMKWNHYLFIIYIIYNYILIIQGLKEVVFFYTSVKTRVHFNSWVHLSSFLMLTHPFFRGKIFTSNLHYENILVLVIVHNFSDR